MKIRLIVGILASLAWCQVRPPNYSPDLLPDTSFTCEDKVSGSYYADVEASCQLFHVCVQVSEYEFQDFHFLCPNDTVFDQQHLVCTNWFDVDCSQSLQFFPHDFAFDKKVTEEYQYEYPDYDERNSAVSENNNDGDQRFLGFSRPALSSGLRNGGRGQGSSPSDDLNNDFNNYEEDEDVRQRFPLPPSANTKPLRGHLANIPIATTPIPLGFVTTIRPFDATPRVKSNINLRKKNRGGLSQSRNNIGEDRRIFPFSAPSSAPGLQPKNHAIENRNELEDVSGDSQISNPFDNPPFISADGRKPRVKANIHSRLNNKVNGQKSGNKNKKQGSKKVELDRSQFSKIDFVHPTPDSHVTESPFLGPEVKPDGRHPRVKANILAAGKGQGHQSKPTPPSFAPFVTTNRPTSPSLDIRLIDDQDSFNQINQSPTRKSLVTFENNIFTSTPSVLNKFNQDTIQSSSPRSLQNFSPLQNPNTLKFATTPTPSSSHVTFFPPRRQQTLSQTTVSSNEILQSSIRNENAPSSNFNLGPPPQPKIPLSLQRNRNRFGMRPRVKANELVKQTKLTRHQNNLKEIKQRRITNQRKISNGIKFKTPQDVLNEIDEQKTVCRNPFKCPPKRVAGGRKPRVKSNIKAHRRNFWNPRKSRVIKRRKLLKERKFNAKLWANVRPDKRTGRKQSTITDTSLAIDNGIDEDKTTTPDPISSLKHLVESKEQQHKTSEIFPPARTFQNKRIRSKQKINQQGKARSKFLRTSTKRPEQNNAFNSIQLSTPLPVTTRKPEVTSVLSLFVTNPNFVLSTTPTATIQEDKKINQDQVSALPVSNPTQIAPQNPFTMADMGLFVTNPRALPDHHKMHISITKPPKTFHDGRKPRVKSNIMARFKNRPNIKHISTENTPIEVHIETTTEKVRPVLKIKPDGRTPRVKSNIKNKLKNKNKKKELKGLKNKRKHFPNRFNGRRGFGRSIDFSVKDENNISLDYEDYEEPEVKPDGRKPRIKSNIKAKASLKGKQKSMGKKKGSFRHSQKVNTPSDISFSENTTPFETTDNQEDKLETGITTFRPVISLEQLIGSNETFAIPPPPATELTVPLPNIGKSIDSERFAGAVFRPTPKGFTQQEPAFSDFPKRRLVPAFREEMKHSVQSATEIVKVSKKDQNLFDSDYNYEDYYYDQINESIFL